MVLHFKRRRAYNSGRVGNFKRRGPVSKSKTYRRKPSRAKFARRVMSVVNRKAEVKCTMRQLSNNGTIYHNKVMMIDDNAFRTVLGTRGESIGPENGNRVGKQVFAKGISVSMMIEQSQKRALCHYWLYLVRNKVVQDTQITAQNQMFEGVSSTIPMDYIDTDKVDVLFCKKVRISMPNQATAKDMVTPSGLANLAEPDGVSKAVITNPQRIEKFYVPLNRKITYRDNDLEPAGNSFLPQGQQRYQWVIVAYDNYSSSTVNDIGKLTMTSKFKFTDV